jgi:hypothetical protein
MYAQPFTRDKRGESIVCRTSRVRCKMLQMRKWTAANRHNLFAVNDILIQPTQRTSQHQFHPCNHALDIVLVVDVVAGVTLFGRLVQVAMIPWPREFVLQCDGTLTSLTQAAASSFSSRCCSNTVVGVCEVTKFAAIPLTRDTVAYIDRFVRFFPFATRSTLSHPR